MCISRFVSEKVYSTCTWKVGIKTRRQILRRHLAPKKTGKERVHREKLFQSVLLISVVLARQNSGKDHMRTPLDQEGCARRGAWDLAKIFTSSRMRTKLGFIILSGQGECQHPLQEISRKSRIRSRFRSTNAHAENWILCEDPGTPLWCSQPVGKCIQTRKDRYTFTI